MERQVKIQKKKVKKKDNLKYLAQQTMQVKKKNKKKI